MTTTTTRPDSTSGLLLGAAMSFVAGLVPLAGAAWCGLLAWDASSMLGSVGYGLGGVAMLGLCGGLWQAAADTARRAVK